LSIELKTFFNSLSFSLVCFTIFYFINYKHSIMTNNGINWSDILKFLDANSTNTKDENVDLCLGVAHNLKLQNTIRHLVCGVLLRKSDITNELEILMVLEAGLQHDDIWYLPHGSLEPNETLEEGFKREVLEETGIICENVGLIAVESLESTDWFRFIFLATPVGGQLKSTADEESIRAEWFPLSTVMNQKIKLHFKNIVNIIQVALDVHNSVKNPQFALVFDRGISNLLCRLCIFYSENDRNQTLLRKLDNGRVKFPLVEFSLKNYIIDCVRKVKELFIVENFEIKILSCLSVECCPKPAYKNDGFCVTLVCQILNDVKPKFNEKAIENGYIFHVLKKEDDRNINYLLNPNVETTRFLHRIPISDNSH